MCEKKEIDVYNGVGGGQGKSGKDVYNAGMNIVYTIAGAAGITLVIFIIRALSCQN